MNAHEPIVIGVDLGGTKIEAAMVSVSGDIRQRVRRKTDVQNGVKAIESQIAEMVGELRENQDDGKLAGVAIGVAGQIDATRGRVRFAPNLEWRDVPLQADLEELLGLSTMVVNDVRAATWGEWLHGAGRGCDDLVCLFIGTGVGGGVVSGGQMLAGSTNTAGELGHITVEIDGPPCSCRNQGCLEAMVSGWAIADRARKTIEADPAAGEALTRIAGGTVAAVTAKTVAQAFHQKDPLACLVVDQTSRALGAGAVSLVNAFNPQRLILGGGVIEGLSALIERVNVYLHEHALRAAVDSLEVLPAKLHGDAAVVGAAALVHRTVARKGRE